MSPALNRRDRYPPAASPTHDRRRRLQVDRDVDAFAQLGVAADLLAGVNRGIRWLRDARLRRGRSRPAFCSTIRPGLSIEAGPASRSECHKSCHRQHEWQ